MTPSIYCMVGTDGRGVPYWDLWTTPKGEANGLPHVVGCVRLDSLVDDGVPPDFHVGVALATAALGSRLLRFASTIHAVRPLFVVRDVLGGADR